MLELFIEPSLLSSWNLLRLPIDTVEFIDRMIGMELQDCEDEITISFTKLNNYVLHMKRYIILN